MKKAPLVLLVVVVALGAVLLVRSLDQPPRYPAIDLNSLPHPPCPKGFEEDGAYAPTALCIPPAYLPRSDTACPAGSQLTMGPALCVTPGADLVEPVKVVS
jgi:hypothetical protein